MRCMRVILAGVRTGAVVAVAWMVLNAIYLAGVGLKQVVTWELGYHGQLICARAGGTTAIIWGMVAATVAGESWRSFGEVFGGTAVAGATFSRWARCLPEGGDGPFNFKRSPVVYHTTSSSAQPRAVSLRECMVYLARHARRGRGRYHGRRIGPRLVSNARFNCCIDAFLP